MAGALVHSASFIYRKRGLETANYKLFILIRVSIGLVFSSILLWALGSGLSGLTPKAALPFIISGGLAGGLLALITTTLAIHYIGASRTHAITSSSPLITALGEVLFLQAVLTSSIVLGTAFVVAGAGLLSYLIHNSDDSNQGKKETQSNRPFLGLILAFYTVIAIGSQFALQKWGLEMGVTPLQGLFLQVLASAFFFGLYWILKKPNLELENLHNLEYSGNYIAAAVAMAVLPLFSLYAMTFLSATIVSALMRVAPLFTVVLTHFFLKGIERVNWKIGLSSCLVVAGAILVTIG